MLPLVLGTALAVGALAFVLYPLFAGAVVVPVRRRATVAEVARGEEHEAVAALREIEFDRETGKLSDSDYGELKARYTDRALAAMRGASASDPVEAAVLAYRARLRHCAHCGPRPQPDALYCSDCGAYLPGACTGCGIAITQSAAAYCNGCGRQLAA